jgi:hypothetical protein
MGPIFGKVIKRCGGGGGGGGGVLYVLFHMLESGDREAGPLHRPSPTLIKERRETFHKPPLPARSYLLSARLVGCGEKAFENTLLLFVTLRSVPIHCIPICTGQGLLFTEDSGPFLSDVCNCLDIQQLPLCVLQSIVSLALLCGGMCVLWRR